MVTDMEGRVRRFPNRKDVEVNFVEVSAGWATFSIRMNEWGPISFTVREFAMHPTRAFFETAVNVILKAEFGLSARRRLKEAPQLAKEWRRQDAPNWDEAIGEAADLIKVLDVMEN